MSPGELPAPAGRVAARRRRGMRALRRRDWQAALAAFERLLRTAPDDVPALWGRGIALRLAGRPAEAAGSLARAVALQPGHAAAWFNLGLARRALGETAAAAAAFAEAGRCRPDWPEARFNHAVSLAAGGDAAEAAREMAAACALRPDWPEAWLNRGLALLRMRDPDAAACLAEAARLRPDWPEAHYNLGVAHAEAGRHVAAEAALREAARLRPGWAQAQAQLGIALAQQPRLAAAEAALRRACELDGGTARVLYHLGRVLRARDDATAARRCFERAAALAPDWDEPRYQLGRALLVDGDTAAAATHWQAALALAPPTAAPAQRVLFVHIPKTGGSTVAGLFVERYGAARTFTVDRDGERPALRRIPAAVARQLCFVGGHAAWPDFAAIRAAGDLVTTVLRDPAARLQSYWRYLRRNPSLHAGPAAALESLDAYVGFLESGAAAEPANPQCLAVCGLASFAEARRSVCDGFGLVGRTEDLESYLRALCRMLGIEAAPVTSYNVDQSAAAGAPVPPPLRRRIEALDGQDVALYRFVTDRAGRGGGFA